MEIMLTVLGWIIIISLGLAIFILLIGGAFILFVKILDRFI